MTDAAVSHPQPAAVTPAAAALTRLFSALPASAWAYWTGIVGIAFAAAALGLADLHQAGWERFALLTAAASVAQLSSVRMSGRRAFHPATIFVVAGALLLAPQQLVLMCVIQHVPEWLKQRYAWYVQPFNIANHVLPALAAWLVADALGGQASLGTAGVAAVATFVIVNRALLGPMIRLSRGLTLRETHLVAIDDLALEFALALMALPLVALWSRSAPVAAISLAPLALIYLTQRATQQLQTASETISVQNESLDAAHRLVMQRSTAALEALSATVDARDTYTAGHSKRVRDYAVAVGRELGLDGVELDELGQAALLHDIGKIGVPDSVLLKEGSLTPLEWLAMKSHPDAGARIIERLGYLDGVVPGIRHHHERHDGHGYPDGLSGDEIPLAARIIHVADALDAMTTRRVYRAAMTLGNARDEIKRLAGADFCAVCVDALERAVEKDAIAFGGPSRRVRAA